METLVTNSRLTRAKYQAVRRVIGSDNKIINVFTKVANQPGYCTRYQRPRQKVKRIKIKTEDILQRVRNAKLMNVSEQCYGESDDLEVCISNTMPMTEDELTATIIHEALHYICYVDRGYGFRCMCTRDEHLAMSYYGRDIQIPEDACISCLHTEECVC